MGKLRRDFMDILVQKGKISEDQRQEATSTAKARGIKPHDALVQLGFLTPMEITQAQAQQHRMEAVNLSEIDIPKSVIELLPETVARENRVLPLAAEGSNIRIITSDPEDLGIVDKLRFLLNREIDLVLAPQDMIVQSINKYYGQGETQSVDSIMQEFTATEIETTDLESSSASIMMEDSDAPIVRLVNLLFQEAVNMRASDIHIEPFADRIRVRYRIDGVLIERDSPPKRLQGALLVRLKIMGNIDITERRRPQDGRIKLSLPNKEVDVRVSVLPTNHGQSVVMRLLDKDNIKISVRDLGFNDDSYRTFQTLIKRPNGIFLVTGPTGSGKTTTLYAALNELNRPDRKIITAEDPVEYYLAGINQCEVAADIGRTFQSIIRAMLRQAPNIILVGEIRDKETADIAIQASLTGHLVFSTLHTNDAPGSITRLIDIGVQPFLVASSLMAVLAQRLVRKVCAKCKKPYTPREEELAEVKISPERAAKATFVQGNGCGNCNGSGYRGRMGIFELMLMSNALRDLTFRREAHTVIRRQCKLDGMRTLLDDGLDKALKGLTTIREVVETTGLDH